MSWEYYRRQICCCPPSEDRCEQNGKGATQFYNKEASSTEGRYHHMELMVLRWNNLHYRLGAEGLFWSLVIRHCWLGHMKNEKKLKRILHRFNWPSIVKELIEFCRSCVQSSGQNVPPAALIPLLVISDLFIGSQWTSTDHFLEDSWVTSTWCTSTVL